MPSYLTTYGYHQWREPQPTPTALAFYRRGIPSKAFPDLWSLVDDRDNLESVATDWAGHCWFEFAVDYLTSDTAHECSCCGDWVWSGDARTTNSGESICETCVDRYYFYCESCDDYMHNDHYGTTVGSSAICEHCLDHYYWCGECEEYDDVPHDHDEDRCDCEAPHQTFRAFGLSNDEQTTVEVPAGVVDESGLYAIQRVLVNAVGMRAMDAAKVLDLVGPEWQTRQGNLTRRVSRQAWKVANIKVGPEALSEIGNLARQHASDASSVTLAFTRDLNMAADEFAHSGSCWWQTYYPSRCALKSWGGMGLRTFQTFSYGTVCTGRAWVLPLNADLDATHDAEHASAYVVFNAYGTLSGYGAARLVAGFRGMTYRRVTLTLAPMYVNGDVGFIVSSEDVCRDTDRVNLSHADHYAADAASMYAHQL